MKRIRTKETAYYTGSWDRDGIELTSALEMTRHLPSTALYNLDSVIHIDERSQYWCNDWANALHVRHPQPFAAKRRRRALRDECLARIHQNSPLLLALRRRQCISCSPLPATKTHQQKTQHNKHHLCTATAHFLSNNVFWSGLLFYRFHSNCTVLIPFSHTRYRPEFIGKKVCSNTHFKSMLPLTILVNVIIIRVNT